MTGPSRVGCPRRPGAVHDSNAFWYRAAASRDILPTGIQKPGCDIPSRQSIPVNKPKMNAGMPIGMAMIVAMIARKTATTSTAINRMTSRRERGSTDVTSPRSRVVPTINMRPSDRSNAVSST